MATIAKSEAVVELSPKQLRAISKALADPTRFQILQRIASQKSSPCSDLLEHFPITAATLSHHIKELISVGLVESNKRGKFVDTVFCRDVWDAYLTELKKI